MVKGRDLAKDLSLLRDALSSDLFKAVQASLDFTSKVTNLSVGRVTADLGCL